MSSTIRVLCAAGFLLVYHPPSFALESCQAAHAGAGCPEKTAAVVRTDAPLAANTPVGAALRISGGERLSVALERYARAQGWHTIWQLPQDWTAPGETIFRGDFVRASQAFIRALSSNGVDVHASYYAGNHTLVISGSGASNE